MSRRTALARPVLVALVCLMLSGCGVGMPDSGPVRQTTTTLSGREDDANNIKPRQPGKGDSPEQIVRGFLEAMRATPAIQTSYAREFLTQEANADWQPTGMVVYNHYTQPHGNAEVEAQLVDADRLDSSGSWLGPLDDKDSTVEFPMEQEDGEYRISDPPPYLLVPQSWFEQRFRQVSVYFFDRSATMLIPEPVFVPRGPQFASALVNAMLQGPANQLVEQNFLPADLRALSVPVSAGGAAQVDLTSDSGDAALLNPDVTELLVSQLGWTLRQDPTIERFGVTIDGQRVQLSGETDFSVEHGHEYAPYIAGSSSLMYGLLTDGLMVGGSPQNLEVVAGPFGSGDYNLRTVSPDLRADQVAGVSADGTSLYLGPVKDTGSVTQLLSTGEDLLRPAWDFRGNVWEVDRRRDGAVVYYLRDDTMRPLDVPGISGEDVKDFLVSRDGSRLIAVLHDDVKGDSIVVSRILTTGSGQVISALAADNISAPEPDTRIRDIAWRSPTGIVMLLPVSRKLFQVRSASVDGAPIVLDPPIPLDDDVLGLAGTPVPDEVIYAVVPGALRDIAGSRADSIPIDARVASLSYVG